MSKHSMDGTPRSGRTRSVGLVAAVCALAAAGGYTGALWADGVDLDAVQIDTGHLDVEIVHGDARDSLVDADGDGVTWFVRAADDAAWTPVDTKRPPVYSAETWVAAVPFTVELEGDNLLADLTLEGSSVEDGLDFGTAGFTVVDGLAGPAESLEPSDSVNLTESFTVELPSKTQADAATYTLLLTFQMSGTGDVEPSDDSDDIRLVTEIKDLDIVLQQNRSAQGGN